jgi:hypothetical protein
MLAKAGIQEYLNWFPAFRREDDLKQNGAERKY